MKLQLISLWVGKYRYFIVFLLLGLLIYTFGMLNDFIWLDKRYILYNADLVPFSLHKLFTLTQFTGGGHYRPLTAIYYSLLINIFQDKALAFKIFQFLIHLFNTVLIFKLFKKFMREKVSYCLALIFLVHPMNVVSVTFISAAAGPLFIFFGLSALLIKLNERMHWSIKYFLISMLLILSSLAREEGLFFCFLILCFTLIYRKKRFFFTFIPLIISAIVYFFLRLAFAGVKYEKMELVPIMRLTFLERLFNIPAIITYYLKTFIFPAQLATNQQWTITSLSIWSFYMPLLLLILTTASIIFIAIKLRLKHGSSFPGFIFFALWFAMGLALYLQFIPLDYTVSNRWFYLPMIGLLGMIGVVLSNVKIHLHSKYINLVFIILIVTLSIRSYIRTTNWKDEVTLFGHDSEITNNFSTEGNLGLAYYQKQQYREALVHLKKSVDMFAYDANLLLLAQTYEYLNDLENAKKYYILAARTNSYGQDHAKIIYKVIAQFLIEHDNVAAKEVLTAGLKVYPNSYRLRSLYAVNEYRLGNRGKAFLTALDTMQQYPNELTKDLVGDIINHKDIIINEKYIN